MALGHEEREREGEREEEREREERAQKTRNGERGERLHMKVLWK